MTFEEWWDSIGCDYYLEHDSGWMVAWEAWKAALNNKIEEKGEN